jgi:hypothetical protein
MPDFQTDYKPLRPANPGARRLTKQMTIDAKRAHIDDYLAAWRELIAATANPKSLLTRWRAERDQRDALEVPIRERLDLLRQIAPEAVSSSTSPASAGDPPAWLTTMRTSEHRS